MREEKGEQKSSENTRIAIFVFRIYKLGYGTFQEIFLENVATFCMGFPQCPGKGYKKI